MKLIKKLLGQKEKTYRNPLMDGDLRNEPCICSSGKKIKHCHGNKYELNESEKDELEKIINRALEAARL
jgi:uncharacterized protein YecA (UPF0149 family)